ncbi:MAG TPA: patatin-like phospholipase family protein [Burkholderiales bacterium]|nr:patatin-like phospholipase family protein [Burkholderiales bacterium]
MVRSGTLLRPTAAFVLALSLGIAGCASLPAAPEHPPSAGALVLARKADRPLIAFVLGGGGARGFAHAGVLKVLDDAGIRADLVVGTSAGSLVGAFYAGGIRNDELVETALAVQREELVDFVFPHRGFIEGNRLQTYIDKALNGRLIEQLDIPFVAVATELATGRLVAFTRGDTGMAVRASCSVPVVFQPTTIQGIEYVDGGLVSPVPVRLARESGADLVIAVDVSRQPDEQKGLDSTAAMLGHAFVVMEHALAQEESKLADVVIRPNLAKVRATDLAARAQAIAAGEDAARAALPRIRSVIAEKTATRSGGNPGR